MPVSYGVTALTSSRLTNGVLPSSSTALGSQQQTMGTAGSWQAFLCGYAFRTWDRARRRTGEIPDKERRRLREKPDGRDVGAGRCSGWGWGYADIRARAVTSASAACYTSPSRRTATANTSNAAASSTEIYYNVRCLMDRETRSPILQGHAAVAGAGSQTQDGLCKNGQTGDLPYCRLLSLRIYLVL